MKKSEVKYPKIKISVPIKEGFYVSMMDTPDGNTEVEIGVLWAEALKNVKKGRHLPNWVKDIIKAHKYDPD